MKSQTLKNAVIVQANGGLGNQLFMLAAGLYVAERLHTKFLVDVSELEGDRNQHGVRFDALFPDVETTEIRSALSRCGYLSFRLKMYLERKFPKALGLVAKNPSFFTAPDIGWEPRLDAIENSVFLRGYFQTWKYWNFLAEKSALPRKSLTSPSRWFLEMEKQLKEEAPASIHIRRGDFLTQPADWGLLGEDYYAKAISIAIDRHGKKNFWVFSDDPELAKLVIPRSLHPLCTFITPPPDSNASESLFLLSLCSGSIIGNSTFSWWGAMLNETSVFTICPDPWFKSGLVPRDLIPPSWTQVAASWEEPAP